MKTLQDTEEKRVGGEYQEKGKGDDGSNNNISRSRIGKETNEGFYKIVINRNGHGMKFRKGEDSFTVTVSYSPRVSCHSISDPSTM